MSLLDDVFDYLREAHRYERYIASLCPFHDDTRPSFFVYEDKYQCSSCGKWGNTDQLLQQIDGSPVRYQPKPKNFHNPWTKWIDAYGSIEKTLQHAQQYLSQHPSEYLRKRAIPDKYQLKAKLGYLDDFYLFPIKDQTGKIVGGVCRAGEENLSAKTNKYVLPAHQDPHLFYVPSWKLILKNDYVFLTYGIIDSLSLAILGYPAMSTTTGKNVTAQSLDWCRKKIYLFPDEHEEIDALKLTAQIGWRGQVVKVNWPKGAKDINDLSTYYPSLLQTELSKYVPHLAGL